jgi:tRNA A22 N-methylase
MSFSRRLRNICSLIDTEHISSLVDIGYDHGLVLNWAIKTGIKDVIGVEVAEHFQRTYENRFPDDGHNISFYTGDGLLALPENKQIDCIILTGLGEERIRKILAASVSRLNGAQQIIISPSTVDLKLRLFLNENGWYANKELLFKEQSKFYVVSNFIKGNELEPSAVKRSVGPRLLSSHSELLPDYLDFLNKRYHLDVN